MNDIIAEFLHTDEPLLKLTIYIIAIILIWSVIRAFVRIAMPVMVIALVMVVFLGFSPDEVINKGEQLIHDSKQFMMEHILPYINGASLPKREEDLHEIFPNEEKKGDSVHSL